MASTKKKIVYVTSSRFKKEENAVFLDVGVFDDGVRVGDVFEFSIREVAIRESLEVDLRILVQEEVKRAYQEIRIPCIVEHAGLVFAEYAMNSYPGGLTKPMWNTLGERFLEETQSAGREVIARAVVAYCNGRNITTFVGDTKGKLAESARGEREFYWDTIFIPDLDASDPAYGLTYAEISADSRFGLRRVA